MLKKSTSEDIKTWKTRSSVNTWKVTGKTLDLDGKYSSSRPNFKNGLQYAKSAGNLRQNAILSRQHQAIEQLEKKKGRLNSIMEVISPFDKVISSSNKKISSKYNKPTSSRKLVKEIFPPPNVPEAAEYGLPVPIYNHNTEAEVVDLPQPPWFALKKGDNSKSTSSILRESTESLANNDVVDLSVRGSSRKTSMEALNRLLEDLKLFSDAEAPSKSPVDAIESVEKVLVSEQLNFPAKTVSASKKRNDPKPKSVQFQKASPPLPRLDLQSQSCVDQFALNLAQSPKLIRQFFALQTSGLSSDEQGKIIHYGFKLESKILELMEQYNNYVKDLDGVVKN